MPFKPNYRQERVARERTKSERKQEKLRKRESATEERKAARDASSVPGQTPDYQS